MKVLYRAKCKRQSHQCETKSVKNINGVWYITGYYVNGYITADTDSKTILASHYDLQEIDKTTLSISFEDMIDSEGTKIFASLSEDGKGGDVIVFEGNQWKLHLDSNGLKADKLDGTMCNWNPHDWKCSFKVTGIQQ